MTARTADTFSSELASILENRSNAHPAELFRDVPGDFWLWINTEGRERSKQLQAILPGVPDAETQRRWTGKTGFDTLAEGFAIYRIVRDVYQTHFGDLRLGGPVLDFGCGWGRVIRYFLKDVAPGGLMGTDYDASLVQFCASSNRWSRFDRNEAGPPLSYLDHSFGFIYAYSVFSHFSEELHQRWLNEFKRVVKPGGAIAVTVRPRRFIEHRQRLRSEGLATAVQRRTFEDADAALARYDAGEFCFAPYDPDKPGEWWGEACIPRSYIEQRWGEHFDIVDFVDGQELRQHLVVLRA